MEVVKRLSSGALVLSRQHDAIWTTRWKTVPRWPSAHGYELMILGVDGKSNSPLALSKEKFDDPNEDIVSYQALVMAGCNDVLSLAFLRISRCLSQQTAG